MTTEQRLDNIDSRLVALLAVAEAQQGDKGEFLAGHLFLPPWSRVNRGSDSASADSFA